MLPTATKPKKKAQFRAVSSFPTKKTILPLP